jgi:thiamine biosynthesis lipoprotein
MLVQLVVTEPKQLAPARELLEVELLALDLACSRFRTDSELVAVANAARCADGTVTVPVSPLLAEAVAVAIRAAQLTDGDVDPTVGGLLAALGYDRDFAALSRQPADQENTGQGNTGDQANTAQETGTGPVRATIIPGWREVRVDVGRQELTVPAGAQLDLGATVKAWAADRAADRIAGHLGCGVLVSLGGDVAVAGNPPDGGWRVRVQDATALPDAPPEGPTQVVSITDGGLATSSTTARRWRRGGDVLHHILDPRTCLPAKPVWRTVSVAAATCADANTAATAAIIRGRQAVGWLSDLGLPARLVGQDGTVHALNAWPVALPVTALFEQPVEGDCRRPGLAQRAERLASHRVVVLAEGLVAEFLKRGAAQRFGGVELARAVEGPGQQPGEYRPHRPAPVAGGVVGVGVR